jgi:hypothetical protein
MTGTPGTTNRQAVFWLSLAAAATAVTVLVVEGPPGSGYGWGSVVVSCLLVAVPLVGIGLMVRSGDHRYAAFTVIVAVIVAVLAVAALVGNWSGQSATNRVLDVLSTALVLAVAAGAIAVEVPLLRRHTA